MRRRLASLLAVAAVAAFAGLVAGGAAAGSAPVPSVSRSEAAALAGRAVTDPAALARLRAVRRIDGRPVSFTAATAPGPGRPDRLRALSSQLRSAAADAPGGGPAPSSARREAEQVLAQRKYHERELPRPFEGPLRWLADRLRPVGRFLGDLFAPILDLPGGPFILGAAVVALGAVATAMLAGRRSRATIARDRSGLLVDPSLDPADLEARAERAAAAGDRRAAVRLRYEAGLLRLVRAERLVLRADTTAADAARQVGRADMDDLTATFEAVVYGGRAATEADVTASRSGWAAVLGARVPR